MDAPSIDRILNRLKSLKSQKLVWNNHWQVLSEYVMGRKLDFTRTSTPGEFLLDGIYDSTAPRSNELMSSSLIGSLWPNGAKSFRLKSPRELPDTDEVKVYYDRATQILTDMMDNPKAGLAVALDEYMLDQGCFGTSGIGVLDGDIKQDGTPILFRSWNVREMSISEGRSGRIDTIYREYEWTVERVVAEYDIQNVSEKTRQMFQNGKLEEKVMMLHAIEPNRNRVKGNRGVAGMPYVSVHIEIERKHVCKEKGFWTLPIFITRFSKRIGEVYGRSPAMKSLPDILQINIVKESLTVARELQLSPPLGVNDDGRLGNTNIDTSPGAVNVFKTTGRISNDAPVYPLFTVGNTNGAEKDIQELKEDIANAFFIDRLLDFNNESEMTAYEASLRNDMRAQTLRGLFARQIAELFTPLIEYCYQQAFELGLVGVVRGSPEEAELLLNGIEPLYIPDAVLKRMKNGETIFDIEYFTPAMRMMQSEEVEAVVRLWQFIVQNAPLAPDMVDAIDATESAKIVAAGLGAPKRVVRSQEAIEKLRQSKIQAVEEGQQGGQAREMSETARNMAQAMNMMRNPNGKTKQ
jgi:hypothetical protein